jgi:hypothetical protein
MMQTAELLVEFVDCRNWTATENVRSAQGVFRFRVIPRGKTVRFDCDFFSTDFELSPAAWLVIEKRWELEGQVGHREKGGITRDCGGGKSCIIFDTFPENVAGWKTFLSELLTDPSAWRDLRLEV